MTQQQFASKGGKARVKIGKRRLSAIGRKGARARWRKTKGAAR